jgi:hypothetical protein
MEHRDRRVRTFVSNRVVCSLLFHTCLCRILTWISPSMAHYSNN